MTTENIEPNPAPEPSDSPLTRIRERAAALDPPKGVNETADRVVQVDRQRRDDERTVAIEREMEGLTDEKIAALGSGRARRAAAEKRNALSNERSLIQLRPVLEAPERESESAAESPSLESTIAPVEGLSEQYTQAAGEYGTDAAAIAGSMNMPAGEMEVLYHFVVNRAVEDAERDANAMLGPGQIPGPDLANRAACETAITRRYGKVVGDALVTGAQEGFKKLPQDVQRWLDNDAGDGRLLTNHPGVVAMLALYNGGYHKLTAERAAVELEQIRQSKPYQQGDHLAIDKAHLLGLIVSRGKGGETKPPSAQRSVPASAKTTLEAELKSLRLEKAYNDSSAPNHKVVVARVQAIYAELYPERG